MARRRSHRRTKWRSLYVWHRYVGVTVALLVLVLAVTGLALNRTDALNLGHRHVQWTPVLDWYGIPPPSRMLTFDIGPRTLSQAGRSLYLDSQALPGEYEQLSGAGVFDDLIIVVADGGLFLFSPAGELIERIDDAPSGIKRVGHDGSGALVLADDRALYQPDPTFLRWTPWEGDPAGIRWAETHTPAPALAEALVVQYRGAALSWERVLLDIHSGRVFGRHGTLLMDIAAVLLIFLAITGICLWLRRKR